MKFVLFVTLIWSILDSGWSITDEDLVRIEAGLSQIQVLTKEVLDLKNENQDLRNENRAGQTQIQILTRKVEDLENENQELHLFKSQVNERFVHLEQECGRSFISGDAEDGNTVIIQNATIEERVVILELQMAEVQEDVLVVQDDVEVLESEVAFLFEEQVIQDERIFNLEERTFDLESTTLNLDGRVETLEGETNDLGTRLTAAETMIEDLQAADVEFDSRISDLEEETTIAFYAVMADGTPDIPFGSTVIFSDVQLNEGNGYNSITGVFTVPPGGEGYYYFATHFRVRTLRYADIDLRVNDVTICTMHDDNQEINDPSNGGCSAAIFLSEGDEVQNVYRGGTDTTPVNELSDSVNNGFTGFRI